MRLRLPDRVIPFPRRPLIMGIVNVNDDSFSGDGTLDFDGFNRGYLQFFGTAENPAKPVRSFVQVAALVNPNWLVEVEIRAARVP